MRKKTTVFGVVVMGALMAPSIALAQGKAAAAPASSATPAKKDEGYGYQFADDPLAAGGFGPNDATIRVRPGPLRTTLIRPRTSFVPEMLKSVENFLEPKGGSRSEVRNACVWVVLFRRMRSYDGITR